MCDTTYNVNTTRGEVRVRAEIFDSHRGEQFGSVLAFDTHDRLAGYLDFSVFDGEAHVKFAEIAPDLRGQGLALRMCRALRSTFPNHAVTRGATVISFAGEP
jgi:ribosomal protein S18 acetylase RimI-like enzyme